MKDQTKTRVSLAAIVLALVAICIAGYSFWLVNGMEQFTKDVVRADLRARIMG